MQANQEIFILVAKEMSISRAAQKAFVSQQCVSDHIKRMEQQYGVTLFTRKPRFQLTEAGASLLASLQKIQAIEAELANDMAGRANGRKGSFMFGISASRAQVILPEVMSEYSRAFPDVEVRFFLNDTMVLEENLRKGKVDLFLGVNTRYSGDLIFRRLCGDELCFMISRGLLRQCFVEQKELINEAVIDLRDFTAVPFIQSYSTSVVNSILEEHLNEHGISLHTPYQISDTETQISLCAKGVGAVVAPRMLLSKIPAHNRSCPAAEYLYVLPIKNLTQTLRMDLVSRSYTDQPVYVRAFGELTEKVTRNLRCGDSLRR